MQSARKTSHCGSVANWGNQMVAATEAAWPFFVMRLRIGATEVAWPMRKLTSFVCIEERRSSIRCCRSSVSKAMAKR
jgi:hypothetical protein